jgi:hypothetical protein
MQVQNKITEQTIDIDENTIVYIQRRDVNNKLPYAKDFDKIKIKEAVKGETVRTFIYADGDKIPEIYKIL